MNTNHFFCENFPLLLPFFVCFLFYLLVHCAVYGVILGLASARAAVDDVRIVMWVTSLADLARLNSIFARLFHVLLAAASLSRTIGPHDSKQVPVCFLILEVLAPRSSSYVRAPRHLLLSKTSWRPAAPIQSTELRVVFLHGTSQVTKTHCFLSFERD